MKDDAIIKQRVSGRSVREIASHGALTWLRSTRRSTGVGRQAITDKAPKHGLALELARLDELQEVFYLRALEGDVSCGAIVTKIIERRCTMLGLHTPRTAVLQIVDEATPKETSTGRKMSLLRPEWPIRSGEPRGSPNEARHFGFAAIFFRDTRPHPQASA
jgi:hypothetical protein